MKREYIQMKDSERLGKYYFEKGIQFAIKREFSKAVEFLKEGLDYMTCDCKFVDWDKDYKVSLSSLFNDLENSNANHKEYLFTKALLLSYSNDKKYLYLALDSIEKYCETVENEYTFYIKAKIYFNLDELEKAIDNLEKASEISSNPRINYRIGRLREEHIDKNGLSNLFLSFINNPSSGCCAKELKRACKKYNVSLEVTTEHKENLLVQNFLNDKSYFLFLFEYEKIFLKQLENPENSIIVDDFISFINLQTALFIEDEFGDVIEDDDYLHESNNNFYTYNNNEDDDFSNPMDSPYYNDSLDMDQQGPEFWDSI